MKPNEYPTVVKFIKRYFFLILIGLGIVLQLRGYLANRSLWVDEAYIALNIINKSYVDLLKPLADNQYAPFGFLFIEKLAAQVFGEGEYALRLFPLVCAVSSLLLFYQLAKRLLPKQQAVVALSIFALAPSLIYYSSELKQYSSEVMIAIILYLTVLKLGEKALTKKTVTLFTAIGVTSILFSISAIVVLTGIVMVLFISSALKRNWKNVVTVLFMFNIWIISFTLYYLLAVRGVYQDTDYLSAWPYLALVPHSLFEIKENFITLYSFFVNLLGTWSAWIGIVLFSLGIYTMFFLRRRLLGFLLLPLIFALLLSGLHKYPFVLRLFLFSMPAIILLIAAGFGRIQTILEPFSKPFRRACLFLLIGALLSESIFFAIQSMFVPLTNEEIKPAIEYYLAHKGSGDLIYIYYGAKPAFLYYAPRYGLSSNVYILGVESRDKLSGYLFDVKKLVGKDRVWILFSHVFADEENFITSYLDGNDKRVDFYRSDGASIYLYNVNH